MTDQSRIPFALTVTVGTLLAATTIAGAKPAAERLAYKEVIVPILRAKCYQCHADAAENPSGKKKIKAKLELTSIAAIKKGGDEDAAAIAGKVDDSLMIERIKLPMDDEDHMPPEGKPQVFSHELRVLEWWIEAGFPEGKTLKEAGAPEEILDIVGGVPSDDDVKKTLAASFAAEGAKTAQIAEQRKALEGAIAQVSEHFPNAVGFVSQQDSDLTFTAVSMRKDFTDEHLAKLEPVGPGLVDVNLGATSITDAGIGNLKKMPNVRKLWLNGTKISDGALDTVKELGALEYLNLYGTEVSDEGLKKLTGLKNLKKLYLWQTKVTPEAVEEFKKSLPNCDVNLGISVQ